jgi:amino-acid racemase
MKTIGLIGGMSWVSSLEYYRLINERIKDRLGGLHSAKSLMFSVDFDEFEKLQHQGRWDEMTRITIDIARTLEKGGADLLVLCANTAHAMADDVQNAVGIPLLHIADATAEKIKAASMKTVGLLGTRFTMEEQFYRGRLAEKHGFEVLVPNEEERAAVHSIIYDELCLGDVRPQSRSRFVEIIRNLSARGAEGVILGCTEIPLLVGREDVEVPLFDTTRIHAAAAVDFALAD